MIYTIEKANFIAEQLRRFTTGYAHHVVGQYSNIEFWLDEVNSALTAIDEYNERFENMKGVQKEWIKKHGTKVHDFCPMCGGECELSDGTPTPPNRMAHSVLEDVRKNLTDNAYFFLLRCHKIGLLDEEELDQKCLEIGTSLEPSDLRKTLQPG